MIFIAVNRNDPSSLERAIQQLQQQLGKMAPNLIKTAQDNTAVTFGDLDTTFIVSDANGQTYRLFAQKIT